MNINLLPADIYTVVSRTILTKHDYSVLPNLYQPLIGPDAMSLYFSLWADLTNNKENETYTHYHLTSIMNTSIKELVEARKLLEGIGLLKTYYNAEDNTYLYLLYAPLDSDDYFNHPVLNVLLYGALGKVEYDKMRDVFTMSKINLNNYEDISSSTTDVFKVIEEPLLKQNVSFKKHRNSDLKIIDMVDLEILKDTLKDNLNQDLIKLLNQLAYVYNLDTLALTNILKQSINTRGGINKLELRKRARSYYQTLHGGELPTVIKRTQPEYLKTPAGEADKRAKMIYVFENTTPYTFLASKSNFNEPTARDLRLLESLLVEQNLKPGVVNVLLDYVLRTNNNKLSRSLVETIAGQWVRLKIETVPQAMQIAEGEYKKYQKRPNKKQTTKVVEPSWFNSEVTKEDISSDTEEELVGILSKYE